MFIGTQFSILYTKYEHRTVSCALSNLCTSPFLTFFLFYSTTPRSLRLLLSVCACTDPHVPPTKIISLIFHWLFSPTASPACRWRSAIGGRPRRRPPRRRASPAPFFLADFGGLSVGRLGGFPVGSVGWRACCGRGVSTVLPRINIGTDV